MRLVFSRAVPILALLVALGGCGLFGSTESTERPQATCPIATVLKPLSQTAIFSPNMARQPINVAFYGVLSEVTAKCDRSGDALHVELDVIVIGERGPAGTKANDVDLQYFVAVTGPDQSILTKRSLPVHVTIPPDAKRAGVTDHVEDTVSLGGRSINDLNIVVGFQQSPEVVDFYKHFRGR